MISQTGWNILDQVLATHFHLFSYTAHQMELEVQRVSRELFKAFNGMNAGFEEVFVTT